MRERTAYLCLILVLTACSGEVSPPKEAGGPREGGSPTDGLVCLPSGVAASCDPIQLTGCAMGSCYVVKAQGPSCVCPAGTVATGQPCSASTECAPGNVCAGKQAPGVCRKTCDPKGSDCPTGMKCTFITDFPQYGYCEPT